MTNRPSLTKGLLSLPPRRERTTLLSLRDGSGGLGHKGSGKSFPSADLLRGKFPFELLTFFGRVGHSLCGCQAKPFEGLCQVGGDALTMLITLRQVKLGFGQS